MLGENCTVPCWRQPHSACTVILVEHKRQQTQSAQVPAALDEDALRQLMQDPERYLGARVRQLREQFGYSQEHLAKLMQEAKLKWGQTTVAKTEAGSRPVRVNEAVALADLFGLTVNDLLPIGFLHAENPDVAQSHQAFRLAAALGTSARLRLEDIAARRAALDEEAAIASQQAAAALAILDQTNIAVQEGISSLLPGFLVDEEDDDG